MIQFINTATGQPDTAVGHDLESCTSEVRAVSCLHPDNSGRTVVFVDTPGFDDTNLNDTEILKAIANWLTAMYISLTATIDVFLPLTAFFQLQTENFIIGSLVFPPHFGQQNGGESVKELDPV
jgi:hypothetical protein